MKRRLLLMSAILFAVLGGCCHAQFSAISNGPLANNCNGPALGIDQVNNVVYSCGVPTKTTPATWKSTLNQTVLVQNSTDGTICNGFAKVDQTPGAGTLGFATVTNGSETQILGLVVSGCGTSGIAAIQIVGQGYLLFDSATVTTGDAVGLSAAVCGGTALTGCGTDLGSAAPTSGAAIFATVLNFPNGGAPVGCTVSPGCWVQLDLGGGGGGGGGTGTAVVTNPATTLKNTVIPTVPTVTGLTVQCPAAAAGSILCGGIETNTGQVLLAGIQSGQAFLGSNLLAKAILSGVPTNSDWNGELTMSSGTNSYTFTGTYSVHPTCTANDETAIAAVQVSYSGTTSVIFHTAGASDIISFNCHGRN